jgi:phage terminase large subunit-like protein
MAERGQGSVSKARRGELAALVAQQGPPAWKEPGLSRSARVIAFLETLPITKGHLRGKTMKLLPAQKRFIRRVYSADRKVSTAVLSTPKGNGKTGLSAGLGLCHLLGPEAIPRGEIYSAAIDRGQAGILFAEMEAIIYAVPDFELRTNIVKHFKKISVVSGDGAGSVYEALSNDVRRGHGLAPSFWIYDELGLCRTRELLSALELGMGKQPGALGIVISVQAADDDHPLSEMIDDGLEEVDQSVYVQLHSAPMDADPFAEATWHGCNFALGRYLSITEFRKEAAKAQRIPSLLASFRNYLLNQRVAADERLIGRDDWLACGGEVDPEALRGRKCWGALDLSSTTDLTALALVFEGDPMPVLPWFWMPKGKVAQLSHTDAKTYGVWVDQGLIETTHGRAIDKLAVALRLAEIASLYDLQALGYDEWRFADLLKILEDEGIVLPLKPMRQGFKTMGPCVDALESAVVDRKILHGHHPTLTMCIANAVVDTDPTGSRKLSKKRSRSRIDGAVCLAMALGLRATEPVREYDFSAPMVLTA